MNKEIFWNLINSGLAAGLVFLGGLSTGNMKIETMYFAIIAGFTAGLLQFKNYWDREVSEYSDCPAQSKIFKFLS